MICFNKSFYYYDIMLITNKSKLQAFFWTFAFVPVVSAGIACLNNSCFHGICIDDLNSTYMCYCIDGYTGVECQTNWDECWSDPCQNGGTCVDGIASYNCTCPDGFIGENCETNFNECESNPCLNNGTCIDMTNEYICHCLPGFSGVHCEVDVAVCNATDEVRCHNGGHCTEGPGFKFYCRCLPGWAGKFCEDQIDECESNPCENGGLCIDIHADYMCACTYGFTGKSCEIQIEFCDENSCSNDALCVVEDGIRVCYCVPDFHGERCELQYDECLLGPRCMNGGTCIDGVDNFTCSCPPNLTGTLCECLMLNETHYDCEYVSPTPLYRTTSTLILNTLTESSSTELISIILTTTNNNVSSENSTVPSETESWTSVITDFISTTEIAQHTPQITGEGNTIQETVTASLLTTVENVEITTIGTTEFITFEPQTQKTIKSDDSKTKTTCKETSDTVTESTKFTSISEMETTMWTNQTTTTDFANYPTKVTVQTPNQTNVEMKTSTTTTTKTTVEEVTLTAKMDTTDKMFTDIPTDYYTTDVTTSYTTDAVETTTSFDKTSQTYTTTQSECTDSVCNNHGSCANTLHGVRCHCTFNYGGRFCEEKIYITTAALGGESYIVHRISNITSISIGFSAKTLITDGHIMHVDIAKGAYMKLFLNSGLLKFKFSCGYQTMLLSELKTYVNKGYPMKIETRLDLYLKQQHCNATLHLNDTVAMSGGQIANISAIDNDVMLYFGNLPDSNNTENKPFVGCIKDLTLNNEKREIFGDAFNAGEITECSSLSCLSRPCLNGGSCREHGDGYICSCANGWMGDNCNQSMCDHNPCQAGGSCVKYPGSGFLCLCPYGKHGIFCEYNVEITRPSLAPITSDVSSFLIYPLSAAAMNSDRFELRLRFHTPDMEQIALLAFVGQNGRHDARSQHLALTFVKGYIMLTWNMGSGPRRVFTSRALSGRRGGHLVRVWRRGRNAGLSVDGRYNVSGNAPTQHQHDRMTLLPYLYIGGHSSDNFADLPHDLPLHSGWRGCVWDVSGQAVGGKVVGGRGVGQCGVAQCTARSCNAPRGVCIHSPATYGCICNEGWFGATCSSQRNACDRSQSHCRGHCVLVGDAQAQCDCPYGKTGENCEQDVFPIDVLFTGVRSYLQLLPREISSVSLSVEAEIKPAKERGLVIFAQTPHFYTALSLQGGLLEYRWTDRLSGLTSLVRSGVVVSMSQWHRVRAGRYGARLYVWIDGTLSTEAMLAHAYPHTASDANIILGGAQDLASVPFDSMSGPPESYSGCIRNLHVNNIPLPFEQRYILGGRNVGACGPTCAGGRCRRGACPPDRCAPPHGRCRRDRCVCAATRAGDHCQLQINVTIPRFDGDSLLSVPHRGSGRRAGGRLTSLPAHLALNFITSEPDGLLLWIDLGIDYLGIGLENGYLRLVWSLHCDGTEVIRHNEKSFPIRPRNVSTILPNVGFLADGNWHKYSLEFGKNITLTIDKRLAYIEETCGRGEFNDDVDIYVGGVNEDSPAVRKLFPQNFRGCVDKISTGADSYITDYSELYSENINSCQLFPAT